jgi:hypothetical protein
VCQSGVGVPSEVGGFWKRDDFLNGTRKLFEKVSPQDGLFSLKVSDLPPAPPTTPPPPTTWRP